MNKDPDTTKWEIRCDEFLKNIDAVEWVSLKELIEELNKIKTEKTCDLSS